MSPPDPRIDLSDSARFTVRGVSLTVHRLDSTTLAPVLVVATAEFGNLTFPLTITDVKVLGETCTRTANATPQELADLMAMLERTDTDE